jgi:hypothetical protein
VPGWSGSLPCQDTCPRPVRIVQGPLLIERTASWRLLEKAHSIASADRLARALGMTFAEVERGLGKFDEG